MFGLFRIGRSVIHSFYRFNVSCGEGERTCFLPFSLAAASLHDCLALKLAGAIRRAFGFTDTLLKVVAGQHLFFPVCGK